MKPLKIAVSFIVFGIIVAELNSAIIAQKAHPRPHASWNYLLRFDNEVSRYLRDRTAYDACLIGPSYCSNLGSFNHIANFGLGGGNHNDFLWILRNNWPHDEPVYYVLTFREVLNAQQPPKYWAAISLTRRMVICKLLLDSALRNPEELNSPPVSSSDIRVFDNCVSDKIDTTVKFATIMQVKRLSLENDIDFSPLLRMREEYPALVFVLHPTLPVKPQESERGLAREFNKIVAVKESLRCFLEEQELPFIDLSSTLAADEMRDLFHIRQTFVPQFKAILETSIKMQLSKTSPNQVALDVPSAP